MRSDCGFSFLDFYLKFRFLGFYGFRDLGFLGF